MRPPALLVVTKPARPGRVETRLVAAVGGGHPELGAVAVAAACPRAAAMLAELGLLRGSEVACVS